MNKVQGQRIKNLNVFWLAVQRVARDLVGNKFCL
jgi:hypothetical protein